MYLFTNLFIICFSKFIYMDLNNIYIVFSVSLYQFLKLLGHSADL